MASKTTRPMQRVNNCKVQQVKSHYKRAITFFQYGLHSQSKQVLSSCHSLRNSIMNEQKIATVRKAYTPNPPQVTSIASRVGRFRFSKVTSFRKNLLSDNRSCRFQIILLIKEPLIKFLNQLLVHLISI